MLNPYAIAVDGVGFDTHVLALVGFDDGAEEATPVKSKAIQFRALEAPEKLLEVAPRVSGMTKAGENTIRVRAVAAPKPATPEQPTITAKSRTPGRGRVR